MDTWLGASIRNAAKEVHMELGGGLSEVIYKNALAIALRARGLVVETEMVVPVSFHGEFVGYVRPDLVVNKQVVLELKAIAKLNAANLLQLRTYLRYFPPPDNELLETDARGAVINFGPLDVDVQVSTGDSPASPTLQPNKRRRGQHECVEFEDKVSKEEDDAERMGGKHQKRLKELVAQVQ